MKYLFSCIAILVFIAGLNEKLAAQPQYYNYNNTGGTTSAFPFVMPDGRMVQSLHLPGSFSNPAPAPGGQITSVFVQLSEPMNNKTLTEMFVKMGQTTLTNLTTGVFYSGPMTTVYYRASVTITNPIGWLEFILDTPFQYDPTQSIVIEMSQCSSTFNTGGNTLNTITSGVQRVWSEGGCPFVPWINSNAYTTHTGFNIQVTQPPAVVTTAATAVTGTTATLNGTVNANSTPTTVSFEYGLTTAYGSTVAGVPATVSGN
ncbi:MAG: hypothetical protein IH596_03940, partial [Bacteroidales bacterium]|nr:hypothetical protein [Bacteroidales bacterium]